MQLNRIDMKSRTDLSKRLMSMQFGSGPRLGSVNVNRTVEGIEGSPMRTPVFTEMHSSRTQLSDSRWPSRREDGACAFHLEDARLGLTADAFGTPEV